MKRRDILKEIAAPEFDYNIICDRLKGFKFPRNKILSMIRKGEILRVKKGLYIKADEPFHKFILANMIYGPSYVSEDSALSWYGLIPERVEAITSMTHTRSKEFTTPVGLFIYSTLPVSLYSVGIRRQAIDNERGFLIATPEKALFDRLYKSKLSFASKESLQNYLFEDLRLDEYMLSKFSPEPLVELAMYTKKPFLAHFIEITRELSK